MSVVAGWYADPADPAQLRYWDGESWTAQTRPAVVAAAPVRELASVSTGAPASPEYDFYGSGMPGAPSPLQQALPGAFKPAPKSRRGLFIGGAGAAVVAAAVAVVLVVMDSGSIYQRTHISMPQTAAGFKQVAQVNSKVSQSLTKGMPVSGMSLAIYTDGDSNAPAAMLMAAHANVKPSLIDSMLSQAESSFTAEVNGEQANNVSAFQDIAPGPLGGKMSCATLQFGEIPSAVCVFVDQGALGITVAYQSASVDVDVMQRLRAAMEKRS